MAVTFKGHPKDVLMHYVDDGIKAVNSKEEPKSVVSPTVLFEAVGLPSLSNDLGAKGMYARVTASRVYFYKGMVVVASVQIPSNPEMHLKLSAGSVDGAPPSWRLAMQDRIQKALVGLDIETKYISTATSTLIGIDYGDMDSTDVKTYYDSTGKLVMQKESDVSTINVYNSLGDAPAIAKTSLKAATHIYQQVTSTSKNSVYYFLAELENDLRISVRRNTNLSIRAEGKGLTNQKYIEAMTSLGMKKSDSGDYYSAHYGVAGDVSVCEKTIGALLWSLGPSNIIRVGDIRKIGASV